MLSLTHVSLRLVVGALFAVSCIYVNNISMVYIERHLMNHSKRAPLFDIGFELLPYLKYAKVSDALLVVICACVIPPLVFFHPMRSRIVRRLLVIWGICFFARAFTIIATILPNPETKCKSSENAGTPDENIFLEAVKVLFYMRVTCGDCLFSGHTVIVNLVTLCGNKFARDLIPCPFYSILRYMLWAMSGLFYVTMICSHFHYTIDIAVGLLVSTAVWQKYHHSVRKIDRLPRWHPLVWYECESMERTRKGSGDEEESLIV